jgi:ribosomal protein S18 acetylase RimI-like enzyme
MVRLIEVKKISKKLRSFQIEEWKKADLDHFGREIDWEKEIRVILAKEGKQVVGMLEIKIKAGVMHIESLIVEHNHYRQRIGRSLLLKAETIAREFKVHKIFLETGADWQARKLYESFGFQKTGDLPNHYEGRDYVEYSKFFD